MAVVTGLTADRMIEIEGQSVVSGQVDGDGHLILTKHDGTEVDAGHVRGANGAAGPPGANGSLHLNVDDGTDLSSSVGLNLTGSGTPGSPWNLSASLVGIPNKFLLYGMIEADYRGGFCDVRLESDYNDNVAAGEVISANWITPYIPTKSRRVRIIPVVGIYGLEFHIVGQEEDKRYFSPNLTYFREFSDHKQRLSYSSRIRADLLPSGLVVVSGMLNTVQAVPAGTVLATLEQGVRPSVDMLFLANSNDTHNSLTVKSNGQIVVNNAMANNSWISLNKIVFWAAGYGNWVNITPATGFRADTVQYPTYGAPQYYVDDHEFVWFRGIIEPSATIPAGDNLVFSLPEDARSFVRQHQAACNFAGFAPVELSNTTGMILKPPLSTSTAQGFSFASCFGINQNAFDFNKAVLYTPYDMISPWVRHTASLPPWSYGMREDGLRFLSGMVRGGTGTASPLGVFHEPEYAPEEGRLAFWGTGNHAFNRIDVLGSKPDFELDGRYSSVLSQTIANSSHWLSLDGTCWIP